MSHPAENSPVPEEEQFRELLFVLEGRRSSTLIAATVNSYRVKNRLLERLRRELPGYKHYELDLSARNVKSLVRAFEVELPPEVLRSGPAEYLVHVSGLENSLYAMQDGALTETLLIPQLNFERENIFRDFPFVILLWNDEYITRRLQREARDLWDWVNYRFAFLSPPEELAEPPRPEQYPPLPRKGHQPERLERIRELEKKYEQLQLDAEDRERLTRDKLNLQRLLAGEYVEVNRFAEAEGAYRRVIAFLRQLGREDAELAEVYFNLGTVYLDSYDYTRALENYQICLGITREKGPESSIGNIYHMMGRFFAEQAKWSEALVNYKLALEWMEKTNNHFEMGSTYHQLGMLFTDQGKWPEAQENYKLALEWREKTGNHFDMGGTYHELGFLFAVQGKWSEAQENYNLALEWREKTGNLYGIGGTYHQLGILFAKQGKRSEALENYNLALKWNEKTSNHFSMGSTYHELGRLFSEQGKWSEALENYKLALEWFEKSGNHFAMGGTYHQLGQLFEEQGKRPEALEHFFTALYYNTLYARPKERSIFLDSLRRIQKEVSAEEFRAAFERVFAELSPERREAVWRELEAEAEPNE